jgi:hypothetical protein
VHPASGFTWGLTPVDYGGGLEVHSSLLDIALHE